MTTVVCFRAGDGNYAVPVEHVREVRSGDDLMPLPTPQPGVVGMLAYEDAALTVLATFGAGRDHMLLLDHGDRTFGLLVQEVTGVVSFDGEIGPPPHGQEGGVIAGVIGTGGGLVLVVDVDALDESLGP